MPGPFPGMDPYLESPAHWRSVHHSLNENIMVALNQALPRDYVARIDERLYVETLPQRVYPDVTIVRRPRASNDLIPVSPGIVGSTAVMGPPTQEQPTVFTAVTDEIREAFVEVVAVNNPGVVVATIELLSPTNKIPGFEGRDAYVRKQAELLESGTHLLEIDLLRAGQHTVAVDEGQCRAEYGYWHYLCCLHRAGTGPRYEVWRRTVRDALPHLLPVPLAAGLPDVYLDLQAALDRVYDNGAYDRTIDYAADPTPPLEGEDAAWADALLREKGLRPDA